jgi:Spy/CpxP family protein refolding chaperone
LPADQNQETFMAKSPAFFAGLFVSALLAQGPRTPPTDQVKTYLSLSDTQVQSLQAIQQQERTALSSLHQQIAQKESTLEQQVQSGSTDAAALGNLLVDIVNLRKQITQQQSSFRTQAAAVLNQAQQSKLKALQDAANLEPTIRQATALLLLTPPAGAPAFGPGGGPGFGPGGRFRPRPGAGPQGFGPPRF